MSSRRDEYGNNRRHDHRNNTHHGSYRDRDVENSAARGSSSNSGQHFYSHDAPPMPVYGVPPRQQFQSEASGQQGSSYNSPLVGPPLRLPYNPYAQTSWDPRANVPPAYANFQHAYFPYGTPHLGSNNNNVTFSNLANEHFQSNVPAAPQHQQSQHHQSPWASGAVVLPSAPKNQDDTYDRFSGTEYRRSETRERSPLRQEDQPPSISDRGSKPATTASTADEREQDKDSKKPVPIMVGKRRGGRVLPTGVVKKQRTGPSEQGRTDAWGQYMAEVRKYKEQSCEEERKNRPLVK